MDEGSTLSEALTGRNVTKWETPEELDTNGTKLGKNTKAFANHVHDI